MILARFIKWIINRIGGMTVATLLLLLLALGSLTWTVASQVRELSLGLLLPITLVSLLLGWGLARLKFIPGWLAALLIIILGVEAIAIRIGRLDLTLLDLGRNGLFLLWQLWRWPLALDNAPLLNGAALLLNDASSSGGGSDFTPFMSSLVELWQGFATLFTRLLNWVFSLTGGQPLFDPVAIRLVWSVALWFICAWAGWATRRLAQPLTALAPAGVLLSTILAYRPNQATSLLPMLTSTLLLLGLTGHYARENRWRATGVDFAHDIRTDLGFTIIPLTIALVALAGFAPSISIREITRLFQQPFQDSTARAEPIADSLGLETQPEDNPAPQLEVRSPGLPRRHLLGSGPELSRQVALRINIGLPPLPYEEFAEVDVPRYYWRSLTYDRYNGRGWATSQTERESYEAGEEIFGGAPEGWHVLRQQVETVSNQGNRMHLTGNLVTADHDFEIDWRAPNDIFAITLDSQEYRIDSLIPDSPFTESELRNAGAEYPEEILERYLELPENIPERVLTLALDLTATEPTAYDRARAIESYLRDFPYNLELPQPPPGRDVVDYFLFDLQEGYCDYYATSMIVLARAAGLPARLAVGYASGNYDPVSANYIVTEADAHSWVEVYFPRYGWVEFEPTAAQPVTDRSDQAARPDYDHTPLPPLVNSPATVLELVWSRWLLLPTLLLLALTGLGVWALTDGWRLQRLAPAVAAAQLYGRLRRHGRRLAAPTWRGETPYEFNESLTARIEALARGKRWAIILNPTAREIRWLTDLYVRASYSSHPPNIADRTQAIRTWQRLRPRLWLAWLTTLWVRFKKQD